MSTTFQRPSKQSLVDLAYEALAEAIYAQRVTPGQRLTIDALSRQLGMSATPIREALARAVALDLVRQDNNTGFRVAPDLTPAELHQLFIVRRALELESVKEPVDVTALAGRLAALAEEMDRLAAGPEPADILDFSRHDHDFHKALVSASGNRFLVRAWEGLHFHLHVHRVYVGAGVVDREQARREHAAIVQAVQDGGGDLMAALTAHIDQAESRLLPLTRSPEEEEGAQG